MCSTWLFVFLYVLEVEIPCVSMLMYLTVLPGKFRNFHPMTCNICLGDLLFTLLHVVCSVGLHTVFELSGMVERMESSQLTTINLTNDDLVKDHLRHLVNIFSSEFPSCFLFVECLHLFDSERFDAW